MRVGDLVVVSDCIHSTTLGAIALNIAKRQRGRVVGKVMAQEGAGFFEVRVHYKEDDGRITKGFPICSEGSLTPLVKLE